MPKENRKDITVVRKLSLSKPIVEFHEGINSRVSYFRDGMFAQIVKIKYVGSGVYQFYFNSEKFQALNKMHERLGSFCGYEVSERDLMLYPQPANNFTVAICFDSVGSGLDKVFQVVKEVPDDK